MSSRLTHVVVGPAFLPFLRLSDIRVWLDHILFLHSFADRLLGYRHVLAIVMNAAVNMVYVSSFLNAAVASEVTVNILRGF